MPLPHKNILTSSEYSAINSLTIWLFNGVFQNRVHDHRRLLKNNNNPAMRKAGNNLTERA